MKRLLATSALLFASALVAQNLTGLWTIHSKINDSESDVECKLAVTNNKITGTCNFQDKDRQVTGTVDGDQVTLQYDADYNSRRSPSSTREPWITRARSQESFTCSPSTSTACLPLPQARAFAISECELRVAKVSDARSAYAWVCGREGVAGPCHPACKCRRELHPWPHTHASARNDDAT